MSYSSAKKIFPHVQSTYFDVFLTSESIATLSLAVRTRFSGEFCSVLNAKKLEKFSRFKPIEVPIKRNTFQKIFGHTIFLTLKNIKFRKKWVLRVCP